MWMARFFSVDHSHMDKCPGDIWDHGGDTRQNTWSNAAALINPESIPVLLHISQSYYGSADGVEYKGGSPFDKFLSAWYAASAPSFVVYGAKENDISLHVEGKDLRKSTKWDCTQ